MAIAMPRLININIFCLIIAAPYTLHSMEKPSEHHNQQTHTATVTHNPGISKEEHAFLQKRLPIVKAALEKLLNQKLEDNEIPKITMICSGGGYRAALCTTGSLNGADQIGLLDTITYITTLSGSTWAVAPWISGKLPIKQFKDYIQECVAQPFNEVSHKEKLEIVEKMKLSSHHNQPITPVDIYGALLGNRLLSQDKQTTTLSQQAELIQEGKYPYPIYTAIDGREDIVMGQTWYEFTPYAIKNCLNNMQIPTSAYGKQFENGKQTNNIPEKSLAYHMGTWGSAFGANTYTIIKEFIRSETLLKIIHNILPDKIEANRYFDFYAKVPNFFYKMDEFANNKLSTKKHMKFVDAGLEINLPYPPVSGICQERTPDILIFLDASAGQVGKQLEKVAEYAKKNKLLFPTINCDTIHEQTISIFEDKNDSRTPIVIYMPRISDKKLWETHKEKTEFSAYNLTDFDLDHETKEGFCKTKHFHYTQQNSQHVMDQTEFNMRVNKDTIVQTIKNWINKKNQHL